METIKKYIPYIAIALIGAWVGFYVGTQYYPRVETKIVEVDKPIIVQGEAITETKTEIAYVPKETIIVKYIDPVTGQETTTTQKEKTDLDAQIGKTDFNVRLNGKDIQFAKTDDEKFVFDKNKIVMTQNSTITFDATVPPQIIDKTNDWDVGIGYGTHGIAGKVDFPISKNNYIGGWIYGDKETKTGGIHGRF